MGRTRTSVWAAGTFAFVVFVVLLTGCTPQAPSSSPKPAATSATRPSASPTPTPAPGFVAGGTAQANKAYFDSINSAEITANNSVTGKAIIDSLVAAGFDKAGMQLTSDKTSINGNADSVLFSVRIGDSCLLGQHSGAEYVSSVQKALRSGACLVGKTRPIDW
jgi:hypothetical protein